MVQLASAQSVVDYLKSKNEDSSFGSRRKMFSQNGLGDRLGEYIGSPSQNRALLKTVQGLSSGGQTHFQQAGEYSPTVGANTITNQIKPTQGLFRLSDQMDPTGAGGVYYQGADGLQNFNIAEYARTTLGNNQFNDPTGQFYGQKGADVTQGAKLLQDKFGIDFNSLQKLQVSDAAFSQVKRGDWSQLSSYIGQNAQAQVVPTNTNPIPAGATTQEITTPSGAKITVPVYNPASNAVNVAQGNTAIPSNGSIVDYLNKAGQPSSFTDREKLYAQAGLDKTDGKYTGSAAQNTKLLGLLSGQSGGTAGSAGGSGGSAGGGSGSSGTSSSGSGLNLITTSAGTQVDPASFGITNLDENALLNEYLQSPDYAALVDKLTNKGLSDAAIEEAAKADLESKYASEKATLEQKLAGSGLAFSGIRGSQVKALSDTLASSELKLDRELASKLLDADATLRSAVLTGVAQLITKAQSGNKDALGQLNQAGFALIGNKLFPTVAAQNSQISADREARLAADSASKSYYTDEEKRKLAANGIDNTDQNTTADQFLYKDIDPGTSLTSSDLTAIASGLLDSVGKLLDDKGNITTDKAKGVVQFKDLNAVIDYLLATPVINIGTTKTHLSNSQRSLIANQLLQAQQKHDAATASLAPALQNKPYSL